MAACNIWKYVALSTSLVLLALLVWGTVAVSDTSPAFSVESAYVFEEATTFDLAAYLRRYPIGDAKPATVFPYAQYLDSTNFADCGQVSQDLQTLNTVWVGHESDTETLLYTVLTDSLAMRLSRRFAPDSIAYLLTMARWANQYTIAAQLAPRECQSLYKAIGLYWITRVSNNLQAMYEQDDRIKYDFDFKYLNQLCLEAKCQVPVSLTDSEKIVDNITRSRWSYLWVKLLDSPLSIKFAFALAVTSFAFMLLLAYYGAQTVLGRCRHRTISFSVSPNSQ